VTHFGKTRTTEQAWQEEYIATSKFRDKKLANAGRNIIEPADAAMD
jgi:hypothetical protein